MKTVLLSLLLLAATAPLSVGQGRFSLSATASPTWDKFNNNVEMTTTVPSNVESIGYNTLGKSNGVALGVTANYQFRPSWSVSTGLWYRRSRGYFDFQSYLSGNAQNYEPTRWRTQNTLQVPVLINFSPNRHRLSPYLSAGVVLSMTYKSLIGPYFDRSAEPEVSRSGQIGALGMVGAGAQYRFNSRWSLIVQPTALFQLKPRSFRAASVPGPAYSTSSTCRYWQLGAQAQVKYTF